MKQQTFEDHRRERWAQFEKTLDALDHRTSVAGREFPKQFRAVCQDLALARDRQFTGALVDRLNQMALRGHNHLYRARAFQGFDIVGFILRDFPRALRREWRLFWLMSVLFYGSLATSAWLAVVEPTVIYSFLDEPQVEQFEQMYRDQFERSYGENVTMFGYYIINNVGIAFRTFAMGLLAGVGSLFIILFNGIYIGLVFGRVGGLGEPYTSQFLGFVAGHGSFELTAIVIAGVAGMRMGLSLLAPGPHARITALRLATSRALPLVYGAGGMLLVAAFIEGFWSPIAWVEQGHDPVRYTVGAVLWTGVFLYLWRAGRPRDVHAD